MQIREATELDIPEILKVLKASLGETSSKKTEAVWRYKHLENPFGKSLILVAVINDTIIGVRALMRWKWQLGKQVFSALRAVDTATHPDHQGKGVFKKLTLKAIEISKEQSDHFIFNTPNTQSLSGYLNMGWEEVNKLRIRIVSVNPLNWFANKQAKIYEVNINSSDAQLVELISKYNTFKAEENKLFTPKSLDYLSWRYENNPLQKYEVKADEDFYLAGYIKEHKYFKELRITEHIYTDDVGLQKNNKAVKEFSRKYGAHLITTTSDLNFGIGFSGNYGPVLSLRDVNLDTNLKQELLQLNNWSYTLGDLELF
ncbi:acetyltransferase (GNAT) family protein [Gillisia mitskevichiae]|uniref:Acetyltransferase (GNAT) family protein n=1 Tax=Gillisia mitskevichiae TaxID=270921 RepID=A0A495PMA9_9FLAO|nr:GNAT family N-acetyltransferase [Gillisia mitskevichiae]RKS50582.1 acetyltransferase (GNAT) family protein [Gillisia mitskevichiae]